MANKDKSWWASEPIDADGDMFDGPETVFCPYSEHYYRTLVHLRTLHPEGLLSIFSTGCVRMGNKFFVQQDIVDGIDDFDEHLPRAPADTHLKIMFFQGVEEIRSSYVELYDSRDVVIEVEIAGDGHVRVLSWGPANDEELYVRFVSWEPSGSSGDCVLLGSFTRDQVMGLITEEW